MKIKEIFKVFFQGEIKSIDKSMNAYYGTHGSRQRINKLIRVGYNMWVLGEACGYVVQFEPYQCVKKVKQIPSFTEWGLGENAYL